MNTSRYLFRAQTILEAAAKLPKPDEWSGDSYEVQLGDEEQRSISFRRMKIKTAKGKVYRWIFDGKMIV